MKMTRYLAKSNMEDVALNIYHQVLEQLQTGRVWTNDHDFVDNYDGLIWAVQLAKSAERQLFAKAILQCLSSEDLAVRAGAAVALGEVRQELGAEKITETVQRHLHLFRQVKPPAPLQYFDLEWLVVSEYISIVSATDYKTLNYFRELACTPEAPSRTLVLSTLAKFDPAWILSHANIVPHNDFSVLGALQPVQRRQLIQAKQPYPPEQPSPFGLDHWKGFGVEEAKALRALMWPERSI